jgi:hypothetical protein
MLEAGADRPGTSSAASIPAELRALLGD